MLKYFLVFTFSLNIFVQDLSLDQKIGQLLMVAVPTNCKDKILKLAKESLTKCNVGSIIFLGSGSAEKQAELIKEFQNLSQEKFLIAKDFEPGFFRLSDITELPKNRTLGSASEELVYELGEHIGALCNLLGVNINFAPVVDVSCNPKNPVIRMRSFGQEKSNVTKKANSFMKGIQSKNVIACAKHFPGHGDTDVDSHKGLPIINHKRSRLEKIEFVPFKSLINSGVQCVMIGHIKLPFVDTANPASLSGKVIDILKKDLKFDGLIVTDALNMKALNRSQSESVVQALKAGNDIAIIATEEVAFDSDDKDEAYIKLYKEILSDVIQRIKKAILAGELYEEEINKKVQKVLDVKGKSNFKNSFSKDELSQWDKKAKELNSKIFRDALVKRGALTLGKKPLNIQVFDSKDAVIDNVDIISLSDFQLKDLKNYDQVVLEIFSVDIFKQNYGLSDSDLSKIKSLEKRNRVILIVYGLPYILDLFDKKTPIIIAHENVDQARQAIKNLLN